MTDSDVDKVLRAITEHRVESAGRFATLEQQILGLRGMPVEIEKLWGEVTALKLTAVASGRFTWGDVFKVVAALGSIAAIVGVGYAILAG